MPMRRLILRRLLALIPTLLFISLVTFTAAYLAPGDPVLMLAGEKARPEQVALVRKQFGLDQPPTLRFLNFVKDAARGDFGMSFYYRRPVGQIIAQSLKPTAALASLAIVVAILSGISLGIIAAVRAGSIWDSLSVGFSLIGVAIPSFVLAPILVYVFSLRLGWLPVSGWGRPEYLVMPVLILGIRPAAMIARLMRTSLIETLSQDFVRTARAKGLSFGQALRRHALPNALPPVVIGIGNSFGFLLTGSFIVETIFGIPGLGARSVEAIQQRDYPVIQATTLLFATLFVLVNLAVDLIQAKLDPRVRLQPEAG